jgi:serine kinase of HPr protein (carbohydrate metabolism regulator)
MKLREIVERLSLKVLCSKRLLDKNVFTGYCCDLLSRVMARGVKDSIWITVQTHMNIVAIAVLLDISCIIIPESIEIGEEVIEKAENEGIVILSSALTGYELCGKLYQLGIRPNIR